MVGMSYWGSTDRQFWPRIQQLAQKKCPRHALAEGGWLPPRSALKSFNARLAVDYPAYSMVICQVIDKLKLVLLFAAQYLTDWVKITVFRQLRLVSTSILPASNQTQRWNSAVRSHLFEWIIVCISFTYRSREGEREREREREMTVVCALPACCVCASLSLQTITSKTTNLSPRCWGI